MVSTILKNMKVNGKDDIPYIMENKSHVWNHRPEKNNPKITTGWWYTYPSEEYARQMGLFFPIYGKS